MTGRQFEDTCIKKLCKAGYWAHRIHPDESGQQPFDIIAIQGDRVCAYDAKVVSSGHRFPLSRIEDNQRNAFQLFDKKTHAYHIGLLILCEEKIYYMDIEKIRSAMWMKQSSVDVHDLPEWMV